MMTARELIVRISHALPAELDRYAAGKLGSYSTDERMEIEAALRYRRAYYQSPEYLVALARAI